MLLLLHWPIVLLISSMSFLYTRHNPHFFTKLDYVLLILIPISQNPFASHSHNIFLSFFPNCWGSKYDNQIWSDEATTSLSMMRVRDISFPLALNMQETGLPWIWWCGRGQNTMQTTIPIQSLRKWEKGSIIFTSSPIHWWLNHFGISLPGKTTSYLSPL